MKSTTRHLFLCLLLGACSVEGEPAPEPTLAIDQRGPDLVSGVVAQDDHELRFESTADGIERVGVTFLVGDHAIQYGIDVAANAVWIDGHDSALGPADVELVQATATLLAMELGDDPDAMSPAEAMLTASLAHLQQAPAGYAIPARSFGLDAAAPAGGVLYSSRDDGIRCVRRGTWEYAWWDWDGQLFGSDALVNDRSCFGKCGDCNFGPNQWTMDCLEHDMCLRRASEAGLPALDANPLDYWCGDEFVEATDDFTLYWLKSCRG